MKTLSENRRARFDYEIEETLEAGIELLGTEVKSAKEGRVNLAGSYVVVRGGEARLINAEIPPYQPKNAPPDYDPRRSRRLLLHKSEIARLAGHGTAERKTLIPLRAYIKNGIIKIEVGVGRGRKTKDKRERLKKRAALREIKAHGV